LRGDSIARVHLQCRAGIYPQRSFRVHSLSNSSRIQLLWKPLVREKSFTRALSHPPNLAESEASRWKAKRIGRRAFRCELRASFTFIKKKFGPERASRETSIGQSSNYSRCVRSIPIRFLRTA
jgi:hypothetical protein